MVKAQCPECRYFFATPVAATTLLCPDCASEEASGLTRQSKPPGGGFAYPGV
jgi:hypothetical protein